MYTYIHTHIHIHVYIHIYNSGEEWWFSKLEKYGEMRERILGESGTYDRLADLEIQRFHEVNHAFIHESTNTHIWIYIYIYIYICLCIYICMYIHIYI
jgi:hypothetical protein